MKSAFGITLSVILLSACSTTSSIERDNGFTPSEVDSNAAINLSECSKVLGPRNLRYNYGYGFFNVFRNTTRRAYINRWAIRYIHPEFLDKPQPQGENDFSFTQEIKNKGYLVEPGESIKFLQSIGKFRVDEMPNKVSDADFYLIYSTWYDYTDTPKDRTDDHRRVDCIAYHVTYCGDGIIDAEYEACDDGNSKEGYGCNSQCKIE